LFSVIRKHPRSADHTAQQAQLPQRTSASATHVLQGWLTDKQLRQLKRFYLRTRNASDHMTDRHHKWHTLHSPDFVVSLCDKILCHVSYA